MPLYSDPVLAQIAQTGCYPGLPPTVVAAAHRRARLLEDCRSWGDINVFAAAIALTTGRYAVQVHGKWHITFDWSASHGADQMRLEKL